MRRFRIRTPFGLLLLICCIGITFAGVASGANVTRLLFPVAFGQPVASTCDGSAPILDRDTGSLAVVYQAGHWYIAYQDRAHGGRGHLAEHVGGTLVEVVQPVGVAPAFSPPDSVKVGSVALASDGVHGRWYYTSRVIDDTPNEGPYALWCVSF